MMHRIALALVATVCFAANAEAQVYNVSTGNCSPVNIATHVTKPDYHYHYDVVPRFAAVNVPVAYGHPAPVVGYTPLGHRFVSTVHQPYAVTASTCKGARIEPVGLGVPVYPATPVFPIAEPIVPLATPAVIYPAVAPVVQHTVFVEPRLTARIDDADLGINICECRKKLVDEDEREWKIDVDSSNKQIPYYVMNERLILTGTTSEFDGKQYLTLSWRRHGKIQSASFVRTK